jgi:hypothetical protein
VSGTWICLHHGAAAPQVAAQAERRLGAYRDRKRGFFPAQRYLMALEEIALRDEEAIRRFGAGVPQLAAELRSAYAAYNRQLRLCGDI